MNNPVNLSLTIMVSLIVVAILSLTLLIFLGIKYFKIRVRYRDILDIDSEIAKRKLEITLFEQRLKSLASQYKKDEDARESLKKEVALLEEESDALSYGIYKPHSDPKTSKQYQDELNEIYELQKRLVRDGRAAVCETEWTVQGSRKEGQAMTKHYSKLMLRAFNGESDSAILRVRWNNAGTMSERIKKAYEAINGLGKTHQIHISQSYMDTKLKELDLVYKYEEKLYQEKEEQRRIQEQIREEEKVQKEIEKAKKDAEMDEERYEKALNRARIEMEQAKGIEMDDLKDKIVMLEKKLEEAKALKERAISRAQMTRSGHVYIVSNIGSLGENVYKIGMTRRLDPLDRVKELGDASVPFEFDIHAMIYSEDAPSLESFLHEQFDTRRLNLINPRKEFFNVLIDEIEDLCQRKNICAQVTKVAVAKEYRESVAIRDKCKESNLAVIAPADQTVQETVKG